jgi:hypothetical protein
MDIFCHTNLDEYQKEEWPDRFLRVPLLGEYVRAKSGKQLKVVRIVHGIYRYKGVDNRDYSNSAVWLELHK